MNHEKVHWRRIPWNHAEPIGSDWYRRTWHMEFGGAPDLSTLSPLTGRLDDRTAMSDVLCVVIPDGLKGVLLDVYMAYPDAAGGKSVGQLEAETIPYDSWLLQRLVTCGPAPVLINGFERHPVLSMAKERPEPQPE